MLPDPNQFDGDTTLWRFDSDVPRTLPEVGSTWRRGTGVVDLARAVRTGTRERASGAIASHVLDVLLGIEEAARTGATARISSSVDRPATLPVDFDPAAATL